jgi:hypothetical protein
VNKAALLAYLKNREQWWLDRENTTAAAVLGGLASAVRRGDFDNDPHPG